MEEFLEISFWKDCFLNSKSCSTFGNIVFQEHIGLEIYGKIPHGFKPCDLEKGIIMSHRFYFLIT